MSNALKELKGHLLTGAKPHIKKIEIAFGELCIFTDREHVISLLSFLRNDGICAFTQLIDLCGVDYPERKERFEVVYHLLSMSQNQRVRVKLAIGEGESVPSVVELFPAANWFEREAFDMYGILFAKHPNLRRILTDYGFEGHPLRKDFPLTGYVEVRYDEKASKVIYEPVKLQQEYRSFDFESPWLGMEKRGEKK